MKLTTRIHLSSFNYITLMAGAALICLYTAVITLIISGFNYHVLIQFFLCLNALYILWRNQRARIYGWDIELFFILMGGIAAAALTVLVIGSWNFFYQNGFCLRSEYIGLFILMGLYFSALGCQVVYTLLLAKKATRRKMDMDIAA